MSLWDDISKQIAAQTGRPFRTEAQQSVGGGCINSAFQLHGQGQTYFVKANRASALAMFEAEARGLEEIARTRTVRVPQPVVFGVAENTAFLVTEYLTLRAGTATRALGEQLAAMHRATRAQFGWDIDNTIGSTPQPNTPSEDWVAFWREQRLGFQLQLARRNGASSRLLHQGETLMERFPALFADYRPQPSLLHGDLWGGNWACDDAGNPVIFDPAVYYGDREADVAMTELFGGFGSGFYRAYNDRFPLDAGYKIRKTLYNLYHILNHFNLFGGGYGAQAETMVERLLAELG